MNDKDTIYRQDAIDALLTGKEFLMRLLDDADVVCQDREKFSWGLGLIESCINDIEELPSAEPRKKGKWIKFNNSCTIRCNQCGQEMTSLCDIQLPNYCLNCGSYNGGEEE